MVNFGPLAAEICWRVWGTTSNFNRFRILAALLHGTLVVGISQTAALNIGSHLYSAGRPLRWALAHILVNIFLYKELTLESWHKEISAPSFMCVVIDKEGMRILDDLPWLRSVH